MAIKYLSNVNIDGTLTLTVNADSDSTYTGIVVSESGLLKYRTKAQILSDIGAGTGSMSSFDVAADTNTANTTISNGETLSILGGTGISTESNPDGTITISASGSGTMTSWKIGSTSGTAQDVSNGEQVDVVGGTKITGSVGGTRTVTLEHDAQSQSDSTSTGSLGSGGNFAVPTVSVDSTGHVTGTDTKTITIGAFDNYTGWKLDANTSGSVLSVGSGATVDFIASTGISIVKASGPKLTFTNSLPFNDIKTAGDSGTSTIVDQGTITIAGGTGISTVDNGSGTITITASGSGTMSSFDISDGSTTQTVGNGDTITFTAPAANANDAGILPVVSATDTVTMNLDLDRIQTVTELDGGDTDMLIYYDENIGKNQKIAVEDIHLNEWGSAQGNVNLNSNKLLNVATGTNAGDGVNLAQVQSLAAGIGVFQGGYNASSDPGTPNISGSSNVALDTGDFYVVTADGDITFSDQTVSVEVGDLIFANAAITASSNPASTAYTIVLQDQNIAGVGSTDGATEKGVAGFDNAVFTATSNGWIQLIDQGITAGNYGSASKTVTVNFDKFGVAQSAAQQDIDITASQVSDFCTAVSTCIASNEQYSELIGTGSAPTTYTVNHQLGTDVMVQLFDTSTGDTVYAESVRTAANSGTVTISTNSAIANDGVKVLVTKVS